ncbi:LPXTG cell wall anchor domain-containing protein [Salinicoccus halitifaciens]|uniref:LPXTG-motif cell wall-anchored protein n=1 Tax=Salinicoccus halitifaciens TaxID=1073415 RepID=A0ABV2EC82_9STAP|nr:LPXTG cell wall anchor domain-containing protein [Salinicoccus halitifaciens]MCD2137329.1 LPXTG cell wall anchor domain-containing protein [Salinicoccus halitifaciens]
MNKKHLKITLISILITSTLFNSANDHIADANEDIDESYQEENDIDDGGDAPSDENESVAGGQNEAGTAPEEAVDDAPAETPRASEDEAILQPADGVEQEIETFEATGEEPLPVEVEGPEEPIVEDPAEDPAVQDPVIEEPQAKEPVAEEPGDSGEGAENETEDLTGGGEENLIGEPDDGGDVGNGINEDPVFEESEDHVETGQPEQYQPAQEDDFTYDQPVEEEQSEALESYDYHYEEPSAEQPEEAGSWNTGGYGDSGTEEVLYEDRAGTAGKKLHRYDYGDILSGISFSPGESDESLALLDKRVNRIMTSKILEEDEVSEEDVLELEEEIKNESGITSSDRDVLPNTGEASNYNYLYSIMLIAAGTILFFMTKRPRQE